MIKNIFHFALLTFTVMIISGCYTQFINRESPSADNITTVIDSTTGDTIMVVNRIDTVFQKEHEVCVWERDLMGYPRLRCYNSYYPRDWFVYNNTPWWYRNDPFWSDYDRCPRYYYFDPDCGCCRYSSNRYDRYGPGPGSPHHDYYNNNGSHSDGNGDTHNSGNSGTTSSSGTSVQSQSSRTSATKVPVPVAQPPSQSAVEKSPADNSERSGMDMQQPQNGRDSSVNIRNRDHRSMRGR